MSTPRRIYVDHGATTPTDPRVVEAMLPFLTEKFGNAGSVHQFGQEARAAVDQAREVNRRSEEHTSELQSPCNLVCRLLLEKKKKKYRRLSGYDNVEQLSTVCV